MGVLPITGRFENCWGNGSSGTSLENGDPARISFAGANVVDSTRSTANDERRRHQQRVRPPSAATESGHGTRKWHLPVDAGAVLGVRGSGKGFFCHISNEAWDSEDLRSMGEGGYGVGKGVLATVPRGGEWPSGGGQARGALSSSGRNTTLVS